MSKSAASPPSLKPPPTMLRLLRSCLNPKPSGLTMMQKALCHRNSSRSITFLTRDEIFAEENPPKRFMELGESALKSAFKNHLSTTYPHLADGTLTALRDLNVSEEKLITAAHRLDLDVHYMIVRALQAGIAYQEPLPDAAVAIAGMKLLDFNYDVHKFWEFFKVYFEPFITPEDLEKWTPEELEKQRAGGAQALSRRPIMFLDIDQIQRDEDPLQRLEELGAYGLKLAMTKHLEGAYPELFGGSMTALREANLSVEHLNTVASRIEPKKQIIWGNRYGLRFEEPISDSVVVMAGKIFVDANYDLDKFWKKCKGHLEPFITPDDLEKRGIHVGCYPILTIDEIIRDKNSFQRFRERGEFAIRVSLKSHLTATYPELGDRMLNDLLEANLSKEKLLRVADILDMHSMAREGRDIGISGEWEEAPMSDYAMSIVGCIFVFCNYDLQKFWEDLKKYLEPIITPEDLEKQRRGGVKEI